MVKLNLPQFATSAVAGGLSSARQKLLYQPEEEEKWYKGETPTSSETLARIFTISKNNLNSGEPLWNAYLNFADDPSSPLYNPYTRPTNQAISQISALGVDTRSGINEDWFSLNSGLKSFYRFGTSGTPLAPSSSSTAENDAAYWYHKISDAEDTTQRAETEWAALQEELAYWVGRTDRNYSDDEVLAKINWSDYPTLVKMDEGKQTGVPLTLNRSVGYSQDAMNGVIWAARNDGGTGNTLADSVSNALGRGNRWVENKDISAKLDPSSDQYNPYAVGCTMDTAGLYFGMSSFDAAWLEENRSYLHSGDQTAKRLYQSVYEAEELTQKAEAELTALQGDIERYMGFTTDADKLLGYLDLSEYPTLQKMDESLKNGDLLSLTRAVNYRWQDVEADVRKSCEEKLLAGQGYVDAVTADLGMGGIRSGTDAALIASKNGMIDASGYHILVSGTDEERTVFRLAKDAGFTADVGIIRQAIMEGETDVAKSYAQSLQAADKYAADNYLAALEATRPYEAAAAARDEAQQALDGMLAANPVLAMYAEAQAPYTQEQTYADEEAYVMARHEAETVWKPLRENIDGYGETSEYPDMAEWYDLLYIDHMLHSRDQIFDFETVDATYGADVMDDETYLAEVDRLRKQRDGLDWDGLLNPETAEAKRHNQQAELWLKADALINGNPVPEDTTHITPEEWARLENQYNGIDWSEGTKMVALQNTVAEQSEIVDAYAPGYTDGLTTLKAVEDKYVAADQYASTFGVSATDDYSTMALLDYTYQYGGGYTPTEWSAYTAYDYALEKGFSYEQVAPAAKQGVDFYQARIDTINLVLSELSARGISLSDGYMQNLNREIALMERNIKDAEYFTLRENENFDQVVEETRQKVIEAWSGFSLLPTSVDRGGYSELSYNAADPRSSVNMGSGKASSMFHAATEAEQANYLYLLGTQGEDAARAYYEHIADETYGILTVRTSENVRQRWHELADESVASGTGMTILSVISSPFQAAGTLYSGIAGLKGEEINPYHGSFGANVLVGETRSTVKENLTEHFGEDTPGAFFANLGYDALTSAGDSVTNAMMFGSAGAAMMGVSAGGGAARDVKLRGGDDTQAAKMGVRAAAFEILSEAASNAKILRLFNDPPADFTGALIDGIFEAGKEGISEAASEALGTLSDNDIMGELSNYNLAVKAYEQEGLTREEAQNRAAGDALSNILYAGVAGAASSGITTMAAGAAGNAAQADPMAARAISALDQAIATPDDVARTKTVAAALSGGGDDTAVSAASAAAQHMAECYGSESAAKATRHVMLQAASLGYSSENAGVALTMASLTEGEARAELDTIVSGDSSPQRVQGMLEAAQRDEVNLGGQLGAAVTENMVATRVKELIGEGGLNGLQSYESAVSQAQQNLENARQKLKQAENRLDTTGKNMAMVSEQYLADPGNTSMRGAVQQATKDVESAVIVRQQMEQSVAKYDTQLTEARNTLNAQREQALTGLREQAVADVAATQQQAAAEREQQKVAAEEQRQVGNVNALEAENFISENGYEGADSAQLDQVRQEVISTAQPVEVSRANVEFAAQVSRRFGVPISFGDSNGAYTGAYDQARGVIKLDRSATQGDVIRKTMAHELTHRAEESGRYKELADTLLQLHYGEDTAAQQADLDAIRAQYADVYTTDAEFEAELVSHAAEEVLGNEESMTRLVAEKPSLARRIWETLKNFINKMRGVNDPAMDTLRRAENLLRKGLDEVSQKAKAGRKGGMQYKLIANPATDDAEQYSYQYLTAQPDMAVAQMPDQQIYEKEKGADRNKARKAGIQNGRQIQSSVSTDERLFVDNTYTGRPLQINEQSIQHGIFGSKDRQLRNAAAGSIVGDLAANAIPVNSLIPKRPESQPWVQGEQLYISLAEDADSYYPVALVVQTTTDDLGVVTHVEALEGISKQYVYSINAHQHKKGAGYEVKTVNNGGTSTDSIEAGYEGMTVNNGGTSASSSISIADLLDLVKDDFGDGFSSDVLKHLGIERPSGQFSKGVKYSLPSTDLRRTQLESWRSSQQAQTDNSTQPNRAERQFASQTAQRSEAMPFDLRQELLGNDEQRYYETDTNREQLERAWERYQQDGFEASRDRILQAEHLDKDDIAMANLLMALAFRSGDVNSAMELAHRYNVEGTAQGQAMQARQLFSRMTPTGARAWVAGGMETQLAEHMRTHQRQRRQIDANAQQVADEIRGMQGGDEVARLLAQPEFTIDASNNRWGIPINEQQQALIDQYNLNRVRRPGVFYNRATTQQRMLEAILATPNPLELTGNGLTLIQRLEYLRAGEAVVTNADLNYIGYHLAAFAASDADTQNGREGDLHLSRAYEAYGNITPATGREKARTWRYTSMLLSVPSALRNVMGNAMQNTINAASHGVAVELDRIISAVTGAERTMAHLSLQERVDGWHRFTEETQNTFRDFFTDRTITKTGEDRYNLSQRGRVFQSQIPEALRLVEGYLMSVGDRNFWRKSYVNSMAEQQRVADLNGVELNYDEAVAHATAEANYATFTEDNAVRDALGALKRVPVVGEVLDFVMPFTGVPTNIISRMWQYSPAGLATSAIRHAYRGLSGQDFNQNDFVNSMSRGLTGTALFAVGMALGSLGYIELGTGEEDDDKMYGIESAQGKQYAPYIRVGDEYISLSAFAPAITPLIMGATANELFKEDTDFWNALYNASISSFDQILDASYMSNLKDIFGGYGSVSENIGQTVLSSAISQNIPSVISQIATALDPYVRDTKEKNSLMEILNAGLIQKIPFLRETLPEKVDVAGRSVESKEGLRNFFDPLTTTNAIDDPALNELERLYDVLGSSAGFPVDALSGRKTSLSGVLGEVEGEDKETYRKRYGELWRLGGTTFDEDGNRVTLTGVTDLIQTPAYQHMDDEEKAKAISGIVEAAKTGAAYEMGEKLGHAPKTSSSSSSGYKKQAVRAMPERFAQSESPWIQELAQWYEKTGDGAFIPKGIGSSFSRSKVEYNLTGAEYDELWNLYEIELDVRLAKIDWTASAEEVAQAVSSAYSSAATSAKDKYVKTHK